MGLAASYARRRLNIRLRSASLRYRLGVITLQQNKKKGYPIGGGMTARMVYDQVTVLAVFSVVRNVRWEVLGPDRSQDLGEMPKAEIESRYDVELEDIGWWDQWSLMIPIGVLFLVGWIVLFS